MPDHDMVVQFNLKRVGGCLQFARGLYVLPGRFGIAGRVIMGDDESGGVEDQSALHDLSRVHGRVTNRAELLHFVGDEIVLAVKEKDSKLFDLLVPHCSLQVGDQRLPIAEYGAAAHFGSCHSARDLPDQTKDGDVMSRQSECTKLRRFR